MSVDLSRWGFGTLSFPGEGEVARRGFPIAADAPDIRGWADVRNLLSHRRSQPASSFTVDGDPDPENGNFLKGPNSVMDRVRGTWLEDRVLTVKYRSSTDRERPGYHLQVEFRGPVPLDSVFQFRERLGDDPKRLLADARRVVFGGIDEAASGLLWDGKSYEKSPEEKGGKKGSARFWREAAPWTVLYERRPQKRGKR